MTRPLNPSGRWIETKGIGCYYVVEAGRAKKRLGVIWQGSGGRWWSDVPGRQNMEHPTDLQARQAVEQETRQVAEAFFRANG